MLSTNLKNMNTIRIQEAQNLVKFLGPFHAMHVDDNL